MPGTTPTPFWQGMIGAAAGMVGQGINAAWQGAMNRKTRKWNEKMYYQQRTDALSDWNRMNEYNSPSAMMARYKESGLNPNLIYGQPNEGASVRSSQVEGWNPKTSGVDGNLVSQMFMMIYDLTKGNQEIANMKEQQELMKLDQAIKGIQKDKFQLDLDTQNVLYGTTIRKAHAEAYNAEQQGENIKEDIRHKKVTNDIAEAAKQQSIAVALQKYNQFLLDQKEQQERMNKSQAERAKISQEIKNLKTMGSILKNENVVKEFQAKITEGGSLPGDNAIFRAIQGTWNEIFKRVGNRADKGLIEPGEIKFRKRDY